ncbi:ArsR/SmtB family transcription factor [Aneurinibacillus terranovensis]|uniref:ArsR/SmtB family transcription factor n=1 Tax=Aneurinibacillus terranovensis TaxID=278991 RepID=UPI0003FF5F5A|nr:metalloregulator ArsR/SmtB family transcription factor [Aneurinibacillus terranovensis]
MIEPAQETCCNTIHQDAIHECVEQLEQTVIENLSNTFKTLADPTRLRILHNLSRRELCVCDLTEILGMTQPAVSHQLRFLKALRIVKCRRDGNTIYYTCDDAHVIDLLQMALDHAVHTKKERGE